MKPQQKKKKNYILLNSKRQEQDIHPKHRQYLGKKGKKTEQQLVYEQGRY